METFPEILTIQQASALLQVSTRTVQRLVAEGGIPARQVGSQWRFDRDQLRAWVRCELETAPRPLPQRELIDQERARLCVDMPETLIDMQQEAVRRLAEAHRSDDDPEDQ